VRRFAWSPADFGVQPAQLADLAGGDRSVNRRIATSILEGERGPRRDIVLVNAAAALIAAGAAEEVAQAMRLAVRSLDSGAAAQKLEALAGVSGR